MPLNVTNLNNNIRAIIDREYAGFAGMPSTPAESAARWADAFAMYAMDLVPPSSTVESARAAFVATFLPLVLGRPPAAGAAIAIQKSVFAFGLALAPGISLASGGALAGVPPAVEPTIAALLIQPLDSPSVARLISSTSDAWFRTGLAVNTATGATINWQ
jgi:hypothetical protein